MPAAGAAAEGGKAAAEGDWSSERAMGKFMLLCLAIIAYIVKRYSLKSQ
jgi:hypothetical protein